MWLRDSVVADVERVAMVRYVSAAECRLWNEHRRQGELRLFTGWCWIARRGGEVRQGFKTRSAALRDAWYVLVQHEAAPSVGRPRLVKRAA